MYGYMARVFRGSGSSYWLETSNVGATIRPLPLTDGAIDFERPPCGLRHENDRSRKSTELPTRYQRSSARCGEE